MCAGERGRGAVLGSQFGRPAGEWDDDDVDGSGDGDGAGRHGDGDQESEAGNSERSGETHQVTLEIALRREFDYAVPPEMADRVEVGTRVKVPFGSREVLGTVTGLPASSPHTNLKFISAVIGARSLVTPRILALARWIAEYYCCPVEIALKAVLPDAVRKEDSGWRERLHVFLLPCQGERPALTKRQTDLLQILEDGQLTDAKGRRVDFRNVILIMTSNLGARQIQTPSSLGFRTRGEGAEARAEQEYALISTKVEEELKKAFRPEFLNRVDASIVFRPLTQEEMRRIVDLLVKRIIAQLHDQGHALTITDAAKDHLIKVGYDATYGARPLRRAIQTLVEDPLAERLLRGDDPIDASYVVDLVGDALAVMLHEEGGASSSAVPAEPVGAAD